MPGLGRAPVTREQELRVVMSARQMVLHGAWLLPSYQHVLRLRKPPLMYWVTAATMRGFGRVDSAFVARLPNAGFSLGLVALIGWGGASLVGRRRAGMAAVMAASSLGMVRFGALAETDMAQAFFCTAATLGALHALRSDGPARSWAGVGLLMGLGFLIKGPASLLLPLLAAAGSWVTLRPRPPTRARSLWALAVFLPVGLWWHLWLVLSPEGQAASDQAGKELQALLAQSQHITTPLFYGYALPQTLLPWGLFLPVGLVQLARQAKRRAGLRTLAAWLGSSLLALTLLKSRQLHYTTLLIAPGCLALSLIAPLGWHRAGWRGRLARGSAWAFASVLGAGTVVLAGWTLKTGGAGPAVWGSIPAAILIAGALFLAGKKRWPGAWVSLIFSAAALMIFFPATPPGKKVYPSGVHDAAVYIRQKSRIGTNVYFRGGGGETMEFHTGREFRASRAPRHQPLDPADLLVVSVRMGHPDRDAPPDRPPAAVFEDRKFRYEIYCAPAGRP